MNKKSSNPFNEVKNNLIKLKVNLPKFRERFTIIDV